MASFGSLIGGFTGDTAKKYADQAYQQSTRQMQTGFDEGKGYLQDYYKQGQDQLSPYAQQGGAANKLYGTYMGLNGAAAQQGALSQYAGQDPFRQHNEDMATRAMSRRYNQMGMADSGNARYAMSRASLDRGSQDYENYMSRLAGMGQQGYGASNAMAGYANQMGSNLGQMRNNLGQAQAGNEVQYANARSQADSMFGNNLMKFGGLALQAAGMAAGVPPQMTSAAAGKMSGGSTGGANFFGYP